MWHKRKKARVHQRTGRRTSYRRLEKRLPYEVAQYAWLGNWPEKWDIINHRRPMRRLEKKFEHQAKHGYADVDAIAWPGRKKPHHYYW